jgi:hypothetical protein
VLERTAELGQQGRGKGEARGRGAGRSASPLDDYSVKKASRSLGEGRGEVEREGQGRDVRLCCAVPFYREVRAVVGDGTGETLVRSCESGGAKKR